MFSVCPCVSGVTKVPGVPNIPGAPSVPSIPSVYGVPKAEFPLVFVMPRRSSWSGGPVTNRPIIVTRAKNLIKL